MPIIMKISTMEKGTAVITTALCSALSPPTINSASVSRPMMADQKMRSQIGASWFTSLRMEVKLASTRAPESAEVTKNTIPRIATTAVVMVE